MPFKKKNNHGMFTASILLMWKPPPLQLTFKKKQCVFSVCFLGKGEGEAFIVWFNVLTMCNDMGQGFVSFEGDVFSPFLWS